ncbi:hypothetical protein [Loktanella sp. R86503]|uniref:hypothetical protein n=1 Tax=Loktanella sp. R86503 TaxID=3093847 RepID=UPI0036D9F0A4
MSWGFSIESSPVPHVKMLSSAASKYRLAKYCDGLMGTDDVSEGVKLGTDSIEGYSAQLMVMLSFVALETHQRMLGSKWQDFPKSAAKPDFSKAAKGVRSSLKDHQLASLSKAMSDDRLKKRIKKFQDGDDLQVLAIISALRNSFSHGKMGISNSISLECGREIKSFLLQSIVDDTEAIISSFSE